MCHGQNEVSVSAWPRFRVRREMRRSTVGANPTRELVRSSPVAIGAAVEETKLLT
jgi:hypothetical protein